MLLIDNISKNNFFRKDSNYLFLVFAVIQSLIFIILYQFIGLDRTRVLFRHIILLIIFFVIILLWIAYLSRMLRNISGDTIVETNETVKLTLRKSRDTLISFSIYSIIIFATIVTWFFIYFLSSYAYASEGSGQTASSLNPYYNTLSFVLLLSAVSIILLFFFASIIKNSREELVIKDVLYSIATLLFLHPLYILFFTLLLIPQILLSSLYVSTVDDYLAINEIGRLTMMYVIPTVCTILFSLITVRLIDKKNMLRNERFILITSLLSPIMLFYFMSVMFSLPLQSFLPVILILLPPLLVLLVMVKKVKIYSYKIIFAIFSFIQMPFIIMFLFVWLPSNSYSILPSYLVMSIVLFTSCILFFAVTPYTLYHSIIDKN